MQENGPKDGVEPKPEQEPGSSIVTRVTAGINFYGCDTGGHVFSSSYFSYTTKAIVICIAMLLLFALLLCLALGITLPGKQMHKEHST